MLRVCGIGGSVCPDPEGAQGVLTHLPLENHTLQYGTKPPREAIESTGSNCFSREFRTSHC